MKWKDVLEQGFKLPAFKGTETLPETVRITLTAVADHLKQSPVVRQHLAKLPKGPGTACPDSPVDELVRYVAIRGGKVDKSDPALNLAFMKEIMRPVISFTHWQMHLAIDQCQDVSDEERPMFFHGSRLARATSELWFKWFERVVVPFQRLKADEREQCKAFLLTVLSEYDYTVFDLIRDSASGFSVANRQTWAQAFPDEILTIKGIITELLLTQVHSNPIRNYLCALLNAYGCAEIDRLETYWAEVDQCWIEISTTTRVLPVHGMENGYEHPRCVSPEFRLEVRDHGAQEMIDRMRAATVDFFRTLKLGKPKNLQELIRVLKGKLERTDVGTFLPALIGGVCLNFRYAGQAVPNRQQILAQGGRTFLDPNNCQEAVALYHEFLDKNCTPKTAKMLKPLITADALLRYITSHELNHPAGRTAQSDTALGNALTLLEESKATIGGILSNLQDADSPEHRLTIVAMALARIIRALHKTFLENATFANYVTESMVLAKILMVNQVIELTPKGIEVDLFAAEYSGWVPTCRDFFTKVVEAYTQRDTSALEQLKANFCTPETRNMAALIAWINR